MFGNVEERIGSNVYQLDEEESHIEVNQELAKQTGSDETLINVCPAHVYSRKADGSIGVGYAACFECGTCLAVVPSGVLKWHYPRGGFGIAFRQG
ncbi:ferredoxin family protein [Trueperella sp. LYQ143]|uniref:ferredoxin family protein n=1 Tax=unclassified Trueperella TaxID=2630174 RepID=UPI00398365AD